jgi:hypothetical protein
MGSIASRYDAVPTQDPDENTITALGSDATASTLWVVPVEDRALSRRLAMDTCRDVFCAIPVVEILRLIIEYVPHPPPQLFDADPIAIWRNCQLDEDQVRELPHNRVRTSMNVVVCVCRLGSMLWRVSAQVPWRKGV